MGRKANNEGSIRYRADGRWEGRITIGYDDAGRPVRELIYGSSQEECFRKLDEERKRRNEDKATGTPTVVEITLDKLAEFWLTSTKHSISDRTYYRYQVDLSYCLPYVGKLATLQIRPHHVTQMYQDGLAAGLSAYQIFKGGKVLRRLLAYGLRFRYCSENVAEMIPLPKYEKKDIHPLSRQQVRSLFDSTQQDRLHALYVLAVDSGARQGELFALEWTDWFPDSRELSITKAVSDCKGKLTVKELTTSASRRRLVVSAQTTAALTLHRIKMLAEAKYHTSPLIFPDVDGGWLRTSNFHRDHWQPALRRAALPKIRFHDLRHTCATLLLQAGDNLKALAQRLGHANGDMVLRTYGQVVPSLRSESARLMEGVLG